MQPALSTKYGFRIRTRNGSVVDNLSIFGKDEPDAERKLRQMYRHCEIVSCNANQMEDHKSPQVMSVEDIITLISK